METVALALLKVLGDHAPDAVKRYVDANRAVDAATDEALSHLHGIQHASSDDVYESERYLLGVKLAELRTAAAGRRRFRDRVAVSQRIQGAVVTGAKRDVQSEIDELQRVSGR